MLGRWSFERASHVLSTALVIVSANTGATCAAEPSSATDADALFEAGKARLAAGDWQAACRYFENSQAIDPSVSVQVKIARCREHEGRLARALAAYQHAERLNQTMAQSAGRRQELQAVIDAELRKLRPRVPRLRLDVVPDSAELQISIDSARLSEEPQSAPIFVDPGEHEVVISAEGYQPQRLRRSFVEGSTIDVRVILAPLEAPESPQVAQQEVTTLPPPDRSPTTTSSRNWLAVATGSAGLAALGAAGYFGVRTLSLVGKSNPHCDGTQCDSRGVRLRQEARRNQTAGLLVGGAGLVLLGTAVVLYSTDPGSKGAGSTSSQSLARGATKSGSRPRLECGFGAGGLVLGGMW